MTVRELREEIETVLLTRPQAPLVLASDIVLEHAMILDPVTEHDVLVQIAELKRAGRLIELHGKLYVRRPPEAR